MASVSVVHLLDVAGGSPVAPKCGYMFMFRSRRTNLTKRLLKARKKQGGSDGDVMVLLKELQENQLGMLCTAVESRGRDLSNCVLLPRERQPHVLCCQTWRWPDLLQSGQLRRLPGCRSACDPVYICCNPYHWSRIYEPGEETHANKTETTYVPQLPRMLQETCIFSCCSGSI